jgi:ATPase subunit of ABC transporter with duplicated ATPase domains
MLHEPVLTPLALPRVSPQVLNYFEQNQADALDLDLTVDQTIMGASTTESYNELRALMAQFMFKGDAIQKQVRHTHRFRQKLRSIFWYQSEN